MKSKPDLHLQLNRPGRSGQHTIVAFDTEWAKNWRAKEKFVPFCASVHEIHEPRSSPRELRVDRLAMRAELYFRGRRQSVDEYAHEVDRMLGRYLGPNVTVVGHQLSSDLHSLKHSASIPLPNVDRVLAGFARRKDPVTGGMRVRDTRYDIKSRVVGEGGEKLRTVSLRLRVFAVQNELDAMSLTKLYNTYATDGDRLKMEMLIVMNWRHAFQTALVWLVDSLNPPLMRSAIGEGFVVTNDTIAEMAAGRIDYLRTPEFTGTVTRSGIREYVQKYIPAIARDLEL